MKNEIINGFSEFRPDYREDQVPPVHNFSALEEENAELRRKIEMLEFHLKCSREVEAMARRGSQLGPLIGVQTIIYQALKMKQVREIVELLSEKPEVKNLPLAIRGKLATIANLASLVENAKDIVEE